MSLYKDASLVMIPSAYKDGKLYSMRPVPEYGSESVTNGTFNNDLSGWTINNANAGNVVEWSAGQTHLKRTASAATELRQSTLVVGKKYYVNVDVNIIGDSTGGALEYNGSTRFIFNQGVNSFKFTASTTLFSFICLSNSTEYYIDNISIKEVLVEDGDFTFSRGSNLAATRVDVNGLIEKGRENLLPQSNQFDTTWIPDGVIITGGQAGYDGTNDAWKIEKLASSYRRIRQVASSSGGQTLSAYAKAGTQDVISFLSNFSGGSAGGVFNLATETWVTNFNTIDFGHESVGNGWHRVYVTFDKAIVDVRIYVGWNDSNAGYIYLQDAQLEQGLVATDYIETTTTSVSAGILEDMPRLDYSGGASCPSLLLEPQRTNLVPYSEYFNSWIIQSGTSVFSNTTDTLSPEGLYNAAKVTSNGANGLFPSAVAGGGGANTKSIYLKGVNGGENVYIKDPYETITSKLCVLTTEWQRFEMTETQSNQMSIWISNIPSGGIYMWGVQLESGSYPTSYIPTYGTSQTRSGDQANTLEDSSLFNLTQGTLFFEGNALAEGTDRRISISDGTTNNYISIGYSRFTGNIIAEVFYNGVSQQPNWGATGVTQTDNNKFALSWGSGTMKFYVNGVLKLTDSVTSPVGLDILRFSAGNGSLRMLGNTKQVAVFPTALTDSEAIALTTL